MMHGPFRDRAILLTLITAGFALRLYRLGAESLWYDETVSVFLAGSSAAELLRHTSGDIHPPGYYLLLRGWLTVMGIPDGRASSGGIQLEWAAGFLSVSFGVALIAIAYTLAHRLAGMTTGLIAAGIVAFSPFNVWYSQETRMYTLGAFLGALAIYAAYRATKSNRGDPALSSSALPWWGAYALAAVAGMYTLYYLIFLLLPLNVWIGLDALGSRAVRRTWLGWIGANVAAFVLYLPWLPNAVRQAIDPPVPPWRQSEPAFSALAETWRAISLGQSAPEWTIPISLVVLGLFGLGLAYVRPRTLIWLTTLGPPALILLASVAIAPLYHVRYMLTFSPAVYVAIAGGQAWLWQRQRLLALLAAILWIAGASATLHAFWTAPEYRADDHRQAARDLWSRWRPGDAVLVNSGYAFTALATYWPGEVAVRQRLTEPLPEPRGDDALVMLTTGHVEGAPDLGWGDPRSDFYAMPAELATSQSAAAFEQYPRIWQYRIYDTVSDPGGLMRTLLDEKGVMTEDLRYAGEANMRLQSFVPREGAEWISARPAVTFDNGIKLQWQPLEASAEPGERVSTELVWLPGGPTGDIATSVRLIEADGSIWAQPPDERPLGSLYPASAWPPAQAQRQPIALEIPTGAPPGEYAVELVAYDPLSGEPLAPVENDQEDGAAQAVTLGSVVVARPEPAPALRKGSVRFGPVQVLSAETPATRVSPGDEIPVEILWQALTPPAEPLVVVVQLLDRAGNVVAGIEEEPLRGRYPTQLWEASEMVRDRHTLSTPSDLADGKYRLIAGLYRAADRIRLPARSGLLPAGIAYEIKEIEVRR